MELCEYQALARETDQNPGDGKASSWREPNREEVIALLGLVGEVGTLLSECKKVCPSSRHPTGDFYCTPRRTSRLIYVIGSTVSGSGPSCFLAASCGQQHARRITG